MSVWEHSRFRIFNPTQHPLIHDIGAFAYTNARLPGILLLEDAINYIVNVLYPNYIGTFADGAALAAYATPAANDYAIVSDDGDGKAAGYIYQVIENTGTWMKRYDVDWSMEAILAETVNRTMPMYVQKYGQMDQDGTGVALTGALAGQHVYGGTSAGSHLTLHANSANSDTTGFLQMADSVRPTANNTFSLGTTANRWSNFFTQLATVGTMAIAGGSIVDSSGAISFGANALSTTGSITGNTLVATVSATVAADMVIASGSITSVSGAISFGNENLTSTGSITGNTLIATVSATVAADLVLSVGSITSASGAISFGDENLSTTGTITTGRLDADNIRLDANTISATNVNGSLTLAANGVGVVDIQSAMTTIGQTVTGVLAVTGQLNIDNIRLDANTISTTNANGDLTLSPNGSGVVSFTKAASPSGDNSLPLGAAALRWTSLYLSTGISDGTNAITIADLLSLRSTPYRDTARTLPAQAGDTIFWDGSKWLASVPDTEIAHASISGLTTTDAGHTQFVMLAGRAGGQAIQGGTAASENLTLESTAHATKGSIKVKDNVIPNTTASYSAGWIGTDLGDSTHIYRDLYTTGEAKGLRFENYTAGTVPAASGSKTGRAIWVTDTGRIQIDAGGTWAPVLMGTGLTAGSVLFVASGGLAVAQDNSHFFYDDATDSLCIGTLTPISKLTLKSASSGQFTAVNTTTSSTTQGSVLALASDDGAALASTDRLGCLKFSGSSDGAATLVGGAAIEGFADGAWSGTSAPGNLRFSTTAASAVALTTRMIIDSTGSVGIGSSGAINVCALVSMTSTTQGILTPRMTTTQRDAIGTLVEGLEIYNTTTHTKNVYNGTQWTEVGSGGGGSSIIWTESTDSPTPAIDNNIDVYGFTAALGQALYAAVRVPTSYQAGNQIKLRLTFYSTDTTGNALLSSVATLVRTGTDLITSTTNQRTSTNAAVTLSAGTVSKPQAVVMDLTSSTGQINSVAVAAGDLILVKLLRGTDTSTVDFNVPVYGAEVTFNG